MTWQGIIHAYKDYLPVTDETPIVSLHEGNTPLLKIDNIAKHMNCPADLYVKFEGLNPSGSFKDRGMTLAVTKAKEAGSQKIICASTGNTSASAAAYAAKANLESIVLIPKGKIAMGKLSQAMMYGAKILQIEDTFDTALAIVRKIADTHPITLVNHLNPNRILGQKTAAFEIIEQLGGKAPTYHFVPIGNAGNITAHWIGYSEFMADGESNSLPKMMGYQAAGSAPIVLGHPIKNPCTVATAIQIGNPASWKKAEQVRDDSHGLIDMVTDEEITEAQLLLAGKEGVFCEPASAASVAGIIKYHKSNPLKEGESAVATLTGNGLKDPDRAIEIGSVQPTLVQADIDVITKTLGF